MRRNKRGLLRLALSACLLAACSKADDTVNPESGATPVDQTSDPADEGAGSGSDSDDEATSSSGGGSGAGAGGSDEPMASDSEGDPDTLDPSVDWDALTILYPQMYSAYDGVHTFSLPAYVSGVTTELGDWQAIPSDAVTFDPWQSDDGEDVGVLITVVRHEPEVTIAARNGAIGGTATLYITDATPEQWAIGEERYHEGEMFDPEALMNDPELLAKLPELIANLEFDEDGNPIFTGTPEQLGLSTDMRCNTCHTTGADNFMVQHTPTQAARFSDEELINIFTEGMKPPGVGYRALPEMYQNFYEFMHTWNVTEEQAFGLVIYLRSLTPEGQGEVQLPTGFYNTDDIDFSKLPPSCNPDGSEYDPALCLLELPPICSPINIEFDMDACAEMLGIDLSSSSGGGSDASP
ncbi:MAG: hypothetical protein PVI30_12685 [Myxococcales bacterium]